MRVEHDLDVFYPSIDSRLAERHKRATELGIRIWQHPLEFDCLCKRLPSRVSWVLETGTAQGGWPYWLAAVLPAPVNFCSVDPQVIGDGPFNDERAEIAFNELRSEGHTVLYLKEFSERAHPAVREWIGDNRLDILHVDGGNTFEDTAVDYLIYSPLIRPGGIIVIHDARKIDDTVARGRVFDLLSLFSKKTEVCWNEGINNGLGIIWVRE